MTRVVAFVQARMNSSRLPGKVMADIAGRTAIEHVMTRAARAQRIDALWLACSNNDADDPLAAHVARLGYEVFRGDEEDALGRFAAAADKAGAAPFRLRWTLF